MIKINLHDYREELVKVEIQKRVVMGIYLLGAIILLIGGSWVKDQMVLDTVRGEVQELDSQVKALEPEVKLVKGMMAKTKRVVTILTGIEKLRHDQMEATRILGDLNLRVPKNIWLTDIAQKTLEDITKGRVPVILFDDPERLENLKQQKRKNRNQKQDEEPNSDFMQIKGKAFKEQQVVEYLKDLEQVPYFKITFIHKTTRQLMGVYPVYDFVIYCYMPKENKTVT
jgi:hypothetical protein